MADEVQTPAAAPDIESPDFDWGSFFLEDAQAAPAAVSDAAPEPAAPQAAALAEDEADEVELLKQKLATIEATVNKTQQTTEEMAQRDKVKAAVEAWKAQASPEEKTMAPLLEQATSLEDIKVRELVIKQATGLLGESRYQIEQEVQRKFGLPVQPTFQPVPEREKVDKMLAEGDLDNAATAMLKGLFTQ